MSDTRHFIVPDNLTAEDAFKIQEDILDNKSPGNHKENLRRFVGLLLEHECRLPPALMVAEILARISRPKNGKKFMEAIYNQTVMPEIWQDITGGLVTVLQLCIIKERT